VSSEPVLVIVEGMGTGHRFRLEAGDRHYYATSWGLIEYSRAEDGHRVRRQVVSDVVREWVRGEVLARSGETIPVFSTNVEASVARMLEV
jgi:hypothetical protein